MDAFPHERASHDRPRTVLEIRLSCVKSEGGCSSLLMAVRVFFRRFQKGYEEEMYGEAPVLAKMKELW